MEKKSVAIIATLVVLVAAILYWLAIYVGVRIVYIVKERDALKEASEEALKGRCVKWVVNADPA